MHALVCGVGCPERGAEGETKSSVVPNPDGLARLGRCKRASADPATGTPASLDRGWLAIAKVIITSRRVAI